MSAVVRVPLWSGVMFLKRKNCMKVIGTCDPAESRAPESVQWRPFTSGTDKPWVIFQFSNAVFVGRP